MSELQTQNITEADVVLGKIANGLQSAASDHILGIAKDIYDTKQQAYQEDINEYLLNKVDAILERDVVADVTIGGINEKDTIPAGTTFTKFVEMLFTIVKAGIIVDPTMSGYADISKPTIKVSILGQNGKYSQIKSGTTIKENSTLKIEIEIPTSETKNTDAKIVKTTTVLAQGYIRKKDDTIDIQNGTGDCEIGTKVTSKGDDYVTIVSKNGCFDEFKIEDGTTKITATLSDVNEDGSLQVKSVSKTYKVLSDSNYTIYAKSNKEETLEEIESKPNRVKTINKDSQIGGKLSDTENSDVFSIKIETWGILPELKSEGNVSINAPLIEVKKTNGTIVNSGEKLSPDDEITVTVKLNGNSTVENQLAYLQKTSNTFQYGWEKLKDGVQTELVKTPSNNQKCTIGCKLSGAADTLLFSGTPSGVFENMKIDTVKNTISFGPITVDSNLSNNSFSVQAKSGTHKILSDANYQITALSNIYSTDENNSKTNRLIIAKDEELKKFNSRSSAISSFSFNLKDEVWIIMPNIVRTGGVVSFGNPTITVKKSSDKSIVESGTTLDPSDKLDIVITLPQSSVSSASYSVDVSKLTYGWKLIQNGEEILGKPTDQCNIGLKVDKTSDDTHTITGDGAFSGLSTTTLTKNEVSVGEGGKLTISSTSGIYTINPEYSDCKIYSISSYGNTTDTNNKYYKTPPRDTINGTTKTATFEYFVKSATYSPFYAWDVEGGVDWSVYDENPNAEPLEAYTGNVRTLVDKIKDNMSDEELSSIGLIKYEGDPYPIPTKLTKFAVFVTSNPNPSLGDILGVNTLINYGDKEYYIVKRIKRNNIDYNIYIYPDELDIPIERKNLIL